MPSFAAVPRPWAGIVTSAIVAVTRPSCSTVVVTAIAQSARPMHERSSSAVGNRSCCRRSTTISSLAFHTHWCPSFGRTRRSCFLSCSKPRPPLYWKWPPIPITWVRRLDSSASCTRGDRPCNSIPTFTASCPAAAFRPITHAGSLHEPISFFR